MSPRRFCHQADAGNHLRKQSVGGHRLLTVEVFGVGPVCVASGVNEKGRTSGPQVIKEKVKARVIEGATGQRNKGGTPPTKLAGECAAKISTGTEEEDHSARMFVVRHSIIYASDS